MTKDDIVQYRRDGSLSQGDRRHTRQELLALVTAGRMTPEEAAEYDIGSQPKSSAIRTILMVAAGLGIGKLIVILIL
jgi:hypothetical protein